MFSIELTEAELIVLNAVLDRLAARDDLERLVPDPSDRQAIHDLVALLERQNPVTFARDYEVRLAAARREILPEG